MKLHPTISIKKKKKATHLFNHLFCLGRREARPLPNERRQFDPKGVSALEWFILNESEGEDLPTRHPLIVETVVIGRFLKGLTKTMWVEDLANGLISVDEIYEWAFSRADAQDVINRAYKKRYEH
jgi:hypothetical protein